MESRPSDPERAFAEFRRTGDPRALGEVYDRLAPELVRLALHLTHDAAEAEDVLQATFVAAIEGAERFDPARRVLPWLVGILSLEAKRSRERASRRPDPRRLAAGASVDPRESAAEAELRERLDECLDPGLARVPAAFRAVLQLRLRHGLSVAEIAAALERSPGTVRSQLARGTERLRRALPAGLAGALLACARPTRGLAAVRTAVVEHASLHGPAAAGTLTAATALGGLLAMKKLAVLAAVLVVGVGLWRGARSPRSRAEPAALVPEPAPASLAESAPLPRDAEQAVQREAAREAAPVVAASPAEPEAPAPAGSELLAELLVHARWPDGSPAAGEVVLVRTLERRADEAWTGTTGADGSARFRGLQPGFAHVSLLRGGETQARLSATRAAELTLSIAAGVTLAGRVRDARGESVPGAEIWLSERYRNNLGHVVARSDAQGAFELRALGPDYYVGARKAGFAPSLLHSLRGASGDRLALELVLEEGGARVRGLVLDVEGRPLADACVLVGAESPASVRRPDGSFGPAAPPQRARSDAEGRFELAVIALGPQPVQARARGFAPHVGTFTVLAGDANECRLALAREGRMVGSVHDSAGHPVAGAMLQAGDLESFASARAWSGHDGSFELEGLGAEHELVRASHPEHGAAQTELRASPGSVARWVAVLSDAPRIEGRVVDARGEPCPDLVVIAVQPDDRQRRTRSERSDAAGRFTLAGLEERAYDLWVQAPRGWREFPLAEAEDVWPGGAPLVLELADERERGTLELEVTTADGTPLAGAELQVWHVERGMWRSFVSSGERGAVRATYVPPGTLGLELRHPEHPWKALGQHRIEAGATLDLGRIALAPSGRLRVRLRGLAEERHASLTAVLTDVTNRESGVTRLSPGQLEVGPLAPGEHQLVLGGDGVRQVRRNVTIAEGIETELELLLELAALREVVFELPADAERPKWIGGTLLDADGTIVWGGLADCTLEPPVARVWAPSGTYHLRVGGEGGLAGQAELTFGPPGTDAVATILTLRREP